MAAPIKQGLDYWPRSVNLSKDPKLKTLKRDYGYLAVSVYELLLDLLYSDKGYYIDYSRKDDVSWVIYEGLLGKYQPTCETIEEIIERLAACELFSGDHFKRKTITSIRAQRTYYSATVDRKMVNINFDIWMLSEAEMKALSSKSIILSNFQDWTNNRINRPNNEINHSNCPQSKVNKTKINESTTADGGAVVEKPLVVLSEQTLIKYYTNHIQPAPSKMEIDKLCDWLTIFPVEVVVKAIDEALKNNNRKLSYIDGVLRNWQKDGLFTLSLVEGHLKAWDDKKNNTQQVSKPKNRFNNFEGRDDVDYAEIERRERERLIRQLECAGGNA